MRKSIIFLALLATLLACVNAQSHNVTWGTRGIHDIHVHRAVVFKKSSFLRKVSDDFSLDLKPTPYVREISQVVVTDQYTNGKGGYATLTAGGPLKTFVKIHFTSQRGHGFNFIIDIYGR